MLFKKNQLTSLIKRVLNASGNTELIAMVEYELSQPMFAHPGLAESYVKSFLGNGGAPEFYAGDPNDTRSSVPVTIIDGSTAILDIRGAMMSKEIQAVCGSSPTSYQAIIHEMGRVHAMDGVKNIVARFDTGGGVVSQMVDAADYIFNLRGQGKKLYAMVDDHAYSAGYGLASSFDEIWVTRTGGVGSVGVVMRKEDRSEANEMNGIKVEYLYAGDKKIFGNSDNPLSAQAHKELMAEIGMHYEMFTTLVARNLGKDVSEIIDTQAGTFTGQAAIDIGFAHKLGTFNDLLTHIEGNTDMLTPEQQEDKKTLAASIAEKETKLANEQAELKAEQEALAALEANDDSEEEEESDEEAEAAKAAKDKADKEAADKEAADKEAEANAETVKLKAAAESRAAGIRAICMSAGKDDTIASNFIASEMTLAEVSASLSDLSANDNVDDVSNILGAEQKATAIASGWDNAFGNKNA